MITCNLMGGLGNQIYQIFTTISYAIRSRNQFKFKNLNQLGGGSTTIRYTFWNTFFANLRPFLITELPDKIHIIREKGFPYNELSHLELILNEDIYLYGYFQSYKYFHNEYSMICRLIGLDKLKEKLLDKLQLNKNDLEKYISMHFRIGDYKKVQEFHPLATYDYYERSLEYIQKSNDPNEKLNILYFCEDVDIEDVSSIINRLKIKFPDYNFERGEKDLADWEQMLYMSLCHHNIIANSSFSWWGAYFNSWEKKIVCYPSVWFGEVAKNDTTDLCPSEWVKIKV
jgi:hypothetical protein